ncbi:hypothetical protein GCM10017581_010990 [Dactylosporangium matsuzakiense]|uniref:Uncharacterized protein n=1 Tax=Dactylosporangium matsuzakiense TaxID=53360 RepID=A0A9W6KEQ9_9ACTN|nr:hypothetical protein GCM10017581_010990 [Dactylosporangium matsuzakiense]
MSVVWPLRSLSACRVAQRARLSVRLQAPARLDLMELAALRERDHRYDPLQMKQRAVTVRTSAQAGGGSMIRS